MSIFHYIREEDKNETKHPNNKTNKKSLLQGRKLGMPHKSDIFNVNCSNTLFSFTQTSSRRKLLRHDAYSKHNLLSYNRNRQYANTTQT